MLCSERPAKEPKSESGVVRATRAKPLALDSGFTFLYTVVRGGRKEWGSMADGGVGWFLLRCSDVTHKLFPLDG